MAEHAKRKTNAKVVHLEPDSQRIIRAKLARLPAAVHSVHDKGKSLVLKLLQSFFDRADDSLFELADKAQSNQEQNLYFDSMREVRVQRRAIEKHVSDAIDHSFVILVNANGEPGVPPGDFSSGGLGLVDGDELEEMVALDATVSRAQLEFGEALQFVSLRLDSLVPVKVYQTNNPLGPDAICHIFLRELKKLDVGVKAKLVLFKLFDKSVVARLGDVYDTVNGIFKDHNVLPSLSSGASSGRQPVASPQEKQTSSTPDRISPEALSTLKNLLGDRILSNPGTDPQTQSAANQLLDMLSRAQHMPSMLDDQVAVNVRSLLDQLQSQEGKSQGKRQESPREQAPSESDSSSTPGQVDDQVMNLVNMLFEFILDDRSLAQPMKSLISRMQIPIIKVAVVDKSFFTKGGHVARRLLNDMAAAAMGWNGDEASCRQDPLYQKLESIVRRLIDEFDTDLTIFSEVQAELADFLEKERRRASVLERRTIDAEDGKAKAEIARTTIAVEVEVRTINEVIPEVVSTLIRDAWSNVLFVSALRHGYESEQWSTQLKTLEDLVWSTQPPKNSEQRQALIKLVPNLLKRLRSGLDTISYNPFEMSDLFKSLEKVHIDCIRGNLPGRREPATESKPVEMPPLTPEPAQKAEPSDAPVKARRPVPRKPREEESREPSKYAAVPEPSMNDLARGVELDEMEEVDKLLGDAPKAPVPPSPPMPPEPLEELPADDPFMVQVNGFRQGAWFDLQNARGESVRCRLAAFIKPTGKYIFVNRNGMKVAEKSQLELAHGLKTATLRMLDDSTLFDRALETVVTSLRKK